MRKRIRVCVVGSHSIGDEEGTTVGFVGDASVHHVLRGFVVSVYRYSLTDFEPSRLFS